MSLWLDESYLKQIGYRLEGFKPLNTHVFNCRCPICGDSSKKQSKRRGYFFEGKDNLMYACHNCQANMSFAHFIKDFDFNLYKQYALEKFKDNHGRIDTTSKIDEFIENFPVKVIEERFNSFYDGLPTVAECRPGHIAYDLLKSRKIPRKFYDELFYCDNFPKWTESFTGKYSTLSEHPRIIIPFWDNNGRSPYFQGRSFGKLEPRYFTYKILEDSDYKAFGIDKIDRHDIVNVVEGPFDSMFLGNCVAVASSALNKFHIPGCKHRYIFDNEKRNKDICSLMRDTIKQGKSIVIWPAYIKEKDLNDMVIAGYDVEQLVAENTFNGLAAQLKFNEWVK